MSWLRENSEIIFPELSDSILPPPFSKNILTYIFLFGGGQPTGTIRKLHFPPKLHRTYFSTEDLPSTYTKKIHGSIFRFCVFFFSQLSMDEGFFNMMPEKWLNIIGAGHAKVPRFHVSFLFLTAAARLPRKTGLGLWTLLGPL